MPRTAQRPSLPGTDEMTLVSLFMRLFHTNRRKTLKKCLTGDRNQAIIDRVTGEAGNIVPIQFTH